MYLWNSPFPTLKRRRTSWRIWRRWPAGDKLLSWGELSTTKFLARMPLSSLLFGFSFSFNESIKQVLVLQVNDFLSVYLFLVFCIYQSIFMRLQNLVWIYVGRYFSCIFYGVLHSLSIIILIYYCLNTIYISKRKF